MTADVRFEIRFLAPFRVSTGNAGVDIDAVVNREDPLPASSLKGVMRATAKSLLGERATVVDEVFGTKHGASPWHWSRARPAGSDWLRPQVTARLQIDPVSHTAARDMLALAEEIGADRAEFTVTLRGRLSPDQLARHRIVLAVAGCATRSLGGGRRRGNGWVSITSEDPVLDGAAVEAFLAERQP